MHRVFGLLLFLLASTGWSQNQPKFIEIRCACQSAPPDLSKLAKELADWHRTEKSSVSLLVVFSKIGNEFEYQVSEVKPVFAADKDGNIYLIGIMETDRKYSGRFQLGQKDVVSKIARDVANQRR